MSPWHVYQPAGARDHIMAKPAKIASKKLVLSRLPLPPPIGSDAYRSTTTMPVTLIVPCP